MSAEEKAGVSATTVATPIGLRQVVRDLATLHPGAAAGNVGKGAGEAGKVVGTGAVKGTGKITKGTGKLIAKPFHHSKKIKSPDTEN